MKRVVILTILVMITATVLALFRADPPKTPLEASQNTPQKVDAPPPVAEPPAEPPAVPHVEPPSGTLFHGRITVEAGGPVAGAVVQVRDWHDVVVGPDLAHAESCLTAQTELLPGEDGTYVVMPPENMSRLVVTVRAPGFVPVTWETEDIPVAPVSLRRDITLRRARAIAGRVLAPDGSPIAGAHVHAIELAALREHQEDHDLAPGQLMIAARSLLWGDGRWDEDVHYRRAFAVTAEDGSFRLPDTDPMQEYVFLAVAEDHGLSALTSELELRLREPAAVRLRVLASDGVEVTAMSASTLDGPRDRQELELQADGTWTRTRLDPGPQRIRIRVADRPELDHDVNLVAAGTTEVEARLPAGGIVAGVVVDDRGHPIPGVDLQLQVEPPGHVRDMTVSRVRSDDQGRFRFEGNPKGDGSMWLEMPGYEKVVLRDLTVPTTDIRVRMRSAVTVRVEVRAPEGSDRTKRIYFAIRSARQGEELGGWSHDSTRWIGKEDPLEIEGVPTGGAEIRFWAHGCRIAGIRADVGTGPGTLLETVTMERASRRVVIVVDDQGRPVEGADLALHGDRPPPAQWNSLGVVTNAEGRATIEFPVEAPTGLYVGAEDRAGVRHPIEPGDEPIRVRAGALR